MFARKRCHKQIVELKNPVSEEGCARFWKVGRVDAAAAADGIVDFTTLPRKDGAVNPDPGFRWEGAKFRLILRLFPKKSQFRQKIFNL